VEEKEEEEQSREKEINKEEELRWYMQTVCQQY